MAEETPKAFELRTVTPVGRQVVQSYREGGFTVGGVQHATSVLVHPNRTVAWEVEVVEQVTAETLDVVLAVEPRPDILLLGTGSRFVPASPPLKSALKERGVSVEAMDTPAACRTYNLLVSEDRRVAAALIALPSG